MLRPASGPLAKQRARASSADAASGCTAAESNAKWAVGKLPHARTILSSMWIDPLVGVVASARGGATGTGRGIASEANVPAEAILGAGLGSELQAASAAAVAAMTITWCRFMVLSAGNDPRRGRYHDPLRRAQIQAPARHAAHGARLGFSLARASRPASDRDTHNKSEARMRRRSALVGGLGAVALLAGATTPAAAGPSPHLSEQWLPSSNGMSAVAWDRTQHKLIQFLEHPYASAAPGAASRNFAFDSYPGVRVGATGTWLNTVAPIVAEYVPGTGIIHAMRVLGGLQLDEYHFAPQDLREYASVMLLQVTQTGSAGPTAAYALFNYHLGSGSPSPGTDAETITYDASRDAFYETGPAGVAFAYASISPSTHHGCTPNNPYGLLNAGADLKDDPGTGGPTTDAVPGFQTSLGSLAANQRVTVGWITVLAPDANGAAAVDRVRTWVAGRTPATLLSDEIAAWQAWTKPAPSVASKLESALALQAQVVLRMGQVQEMGSPAGQILASVAPGQWNIAWVRDMAYATVGLVRSGHSSEAKAAIAFQLGAQAGTYQEEVGAPYQISVVRYYGNGTEWSDANADGPNIELDGFGLFLWELDAYVQATGDMAALGAWWPLVKSKVADVLVGLEEPTGLIKPDSSIWEVHWNGQQKHFAYTTIAVANGLCAAARLAKAAGDTVSAGTYVAAGQKARDALITQLRAPDGTLAQSTESLAGGTQWLDAAVLEAIDFGLIDPTLHTAAATLASIEAGLVPQSGWGFMRSDAGDWYSSNEWVFVDLRAARALELTGDASYSANLFAWNVAQASDNFGELSELHDPVTADYAGQSPMVGFGAGAYLLHLYERGTPGAPACETYAAEPVLPADGGRGGAGTGGSGVGGAGVGGHATGGGAGGGFEVGGTGPGGTHQPSGGSKACGCDVAYAPTFIDVLVALVPLGLLRWRRRHR
jgi:hypothetical protein